MSRISRIVAHTVAERNDWFADCLPGYVLFLDEGIEPSPEAVGALAEEMERDPLTALVGPTWDGEGRRWNTALSTDGHPAPSNAPPEVLDGSCLLARTTLLPVKPFDRRYEPRFFEDADLCLYLRAQGHRIATADCTVEPSVVEPGPDDDPTGEYFRSWARFRNRWAFYLQHRRFNERVAVRRTAAAGDVFLATAILHWLHRENPGREIFFVTHPTYTDMTPEYATWWPVGSLPDRVDRLIDLDDAYELRPDCHILEAYGRVAGVERWEELRP